MVKTKKRGRPRVKLDTAQVEKLAEIQCSLEEMAAVLDCSVSTLQRNFDQAIKRGREQGKTSLRRRQYELAMAGNTAMLIWLGKQYLGQADKQEVAVPGELPVLRIRRETQA